MHKADFIAVLRHPRSSLARRYGKIRAFRFLRRYYRDLRRREPDPELLWDRLERWTENTLRRTPPAELLRRPVPAVEERVGFRAVLYRYAHALSEYALRFPNEPHRRLDLLEQDLTELRGIRMPRTT